MTCFLFPKYIPKDTPFTKDVSTRGDPASLKSSVITIKARNDCGKYCLQTGFPEFSKIDESLGDRGTSGDTYLQ